MLELRDHAQNRGVYRNSSSWGRVTCLQNDCSFHNMQCQACHCLIVDLYISYSATWGCSSDVRFHCVPAGGYITRCLHPSEPSLRNWAFQAVALVPTCWEAKQNSDFNRAGVSAAYAEHNFRVHCFAHCLCTKRLCLKRRRRGFDGFC